MRLLLQFTFFFFFTIFSIDAKCHSPQCHLGTISTNKGDAFTPNDGDPVAAEDGCVLVLEPNCDVQSRLRASDYKVDYGKCKNMSVGVTVCAQSSENHDDFLDPHYDVEVFDKLISESGLSHCRSLRDKFVGISRESCLTRTQFIVIICVVVGIVLFILIVTGITVFFVVDTKRKNFGAKERGKNNEVMRFKREQDAMEVARNPLDNYDDPNGPPTLNDYKRGPPTLNQRARQANAPYVDPRMNGMPMNPYCDPNAPPMMY